eukprot:340629-Hanusia_phi.AAC.10
MASPASQLASHLPSCLPACLPACLPDLLPPSFPACLSPSSIPASLPVSHPSAKFLDCITQPNKSKTQNKKFQCQPEGLTAESGPTVWRRPVLSGPDHLGPARPGPVAGPAPRAAVCRAIAAWPGTARPPPAAGG